MKKTITLIIILGLLISCFTGCQSATSTILPNNIDFEEFETLAVDLDEKLVAKNRVVYWNQKNGLVIEEINNVFTRCVKLPLGAKYAGYSYWASYLFQFGNKVYSVFPNNVPEDIILVSRSVINIVECNEYLTSDAFSNPVLLMKDGTLKGYITWDKKLVDYPVKDN